MLKKKFVGGALLVVIYAGAGAVELRGNATYLQGNPAGQQFGIRVTPTGNQCNLSFSWPVESNSAPRRVDLHLVQFNKLCTEFEKIGLIEPVTGGWRATAKAMELRLKGPSAVAATRMDGL